MGAYPLESLLSVRRYRESQAAVAVRAAEEDLKQAEALVERSRVELAEYKSWRRLEEDRRYDAIMAKPCTLEKLDAFKDGLAQLAGGELLKEEAVQKAEKNVVRCETALQDARTAARAAQKETAKIQAHKDIWSEEDKKEAERREDLELEEFKPLSRKGAEAEGDDA